jgi:hypothetical protein
MNPQKFKRGDIVHIAADLGESMSHFEKDKDVVIIGSYADQFGGNDTKSYTVLFLDDGNEVSWYEEHQLTFLYHGGENLISKIVKQRQERHKIESDLGWIISNWGKIRKQGAPAATICKLMSLIGITNPWGKHGEGIDYHNHANYTMKCLDPILSTGDIKKVEQFIAEFPKVDEFIFSSDLYNGNNELRKPEFIPSERW